MGWLNRLERALGPLAIPNLALYLIGGQILFFGLSLLGRFDIDLITLIPAYVLEGQFWRVFSFAFVPPVWGQVSLTGAVFLAISWYFFYMISQALENYWGAFRFNLFFLVGWVLTVGVSFLTPELRTGYAFFAISVFLAFALLNPDFELYIFFILPVKIKWLALLLWVVLIFGFVTGDWRTRLSILASVSNYFLFFGGEILQRMRTGRRHMQQQARRAKLQEEAAEPRHRCTVCGKTDLTHPLEDFRYCSQCTGEDCYCSEHIKNHVHTTAPKSV